jgi:mannose-6-phosphate isomerase-like protein (cupin superfamily)
MKKFRVVFAMILMAFMSIAADQAINSSVFDWTKLPVKKTSSGEVRDILIGPTRSLDMFDVKAITLNEEQSIKTYKVESGFDELLIIKEGSAEIGVNNENKILEAGSIVVASQGDKLNIRNLHNSKTTYYLFRFKPKSQPGQPQSVTKVLPVLEYWSSFIFKPSANGGRRDILKQPTSTLKELEIHATTLNEGLPSHAPHAHPDEEIILVRFGTVEQTINGASYKVGPGSVIFITNDDMHGISNAGKGKCEYYAFRWLTYAADAK